MSRGKILAAFSVSALVLAAMQIVGDALFVVHQTEWIYTPMHYVGGIVVGFFALYVASGLGIRATRDRMLVAILFVGIAWELLEHFSGFKLMVLDTSTDLIADVLGAFTAYWYARRRL